MIYSEFKFEEKVVALQRLFLLEMVPVCVVHSRLPTVAFCGMLLPGNIRFCHDHFECPVSGMGCDAVTGLADEHPTRFFAEILAALTISQQARIRKGEIPRRIYLIYAAFHIPSLLLLQTSGNKKVIGQGMNRIKKIRPLCQWILSDPGFYAQSWRKEGPGPARYLDVLSQRQCAQKTNRKNESECSIYTKILEKR